MSTFYSDLAKEIEKENNPSNFNGILNDGDDLDDILNSFDHKNNYKVQNSIITQNGDIHSCLELRGHTERNKSQTKSRRTILDTLIDPFDDPVLTKTVKPADHLDSEVVTESKRHPNSSILKRTVRFLDDIEDGNPEESISKQSDDAFGPDQFNLDQQTYKSLFNNKNDSNSLRPQTAPTSSEFGKSTSKNLFLDDDKSSSNQVLNLLNDKKSIENFESVKSNRSQTRRPLSLESVNRIPYDFNRLDIDHLRSASSITPSDKKSTNYESMECEAQIKRLEMERDNLIHLLELIKKQHHEELSILEQTSKSRLDLMKESAERKENRLREEITYLETQNRERLIQIEEKRDLLLTDLTAKLNEARQIHQRELDELKRSHNEEIEILKQRHQELIDRLKSASQFEIRTITELQPNSEELKNLLEQMKTTLIDLSRLEQEQIRNTTIRHDQLTRREDALRVLEDRINQRETSLDYERKQIADSFTKLEIQFREHTKLATDDRWSIKQEHDRLAKSKISLEEERRCLIEQSGRARVEMQQLVSNFINEHRNSQAKILEERNLITDEHQRLRTEQMNWEEKQKTNELALKKAKEDIDTMKETLALERQTLNEKLNKLRIDEVKLEETRRQLDIVRCDLVREQELLTHREEYLDQREDELNKRAEVLNQTEKLLKDSESRHRRLQDEQSRQFVELQERNHKLHEAEKHLVHEKKELAQQMDKLAKRKLEVDNLRQSICLNCRIPVKENGSSAPLFHHNKLGNGNAITKANKRILTVNENKK
ncbi:Fas-binding factor 1, partial [Schistosoma japonicum]